MDRVSSSKPFMATMRHGQRRLARSVQLRFRQSEVNLTGILEPFYYNDTSTCLWSGGVRRRTQRQATLPPPRRSSFSCHVGVSRAAGWWKAKEESIRQRNG